MQSIVFTLDHALLCMTVLLVISFTNIANEKLSCNVVDRNKILLDTAFYLPGLQCDDWDANWLLRLKLGFGDLNMPFRTLRSILAAVIFCEINRLIK